VPAVVKISANFTTDKSVTSRKTAFTRADPAGVLRGLLLTEDAAKAREQSQHRETNQFRELRGQRTCQRDQLELFCGHPADESGQAVGRESIRADNVIAVTVAGFELQRCKDVVCIDFAEKANVWRYSIPTRNSSV